MIKLDFVSSKQIHQQLKTDHLSVLDIVFIDKSKGIIFWKTRWIDFRAGMSLFPWHHLHVLHFYTLIDRGRSKEGKQNASHILAGVACADCIQHAPSTIPSCIGSHFFWQ